MLIIAHIRSLALVAAAAVQDNFIDLVDCLLGPTGGFKLSLDYGANFEVGFL